MTELLRSENQRTQLMGQNRMEFLLFKLDNSTQSYAINVFKVREAQPCPKLTRVPCMHRYVRGVAHIRGQNISIIDLRAASGGKPIDDTSKAFVIITEYNSTVQGFLVASVVQIVNLNWKNILPPPEGIGKNNYLTSIAQVGDDLVDIIDVEKVLDEINPNNINISEVINNKIMPDNLEGKFIFIADDSSVARLQLKKTINEMGIDVIEAHDGEEALEMLHEINNTESLRENLLMVISDIEMPKMDGYTLCSTIKTSEELKDIYVILHSSLSGMRDDSVFDKFGANDFIPKFSADVLADAIITGISAIK
ncbi:chemotaxis protein [Photobacterium toruni]|uniref:chemotaxis protein n=1 Tax=Photobacterium toruni TaxID=1935446 RepID=UPI00210FCA54|nr:chemotaxis protein [Photobacterium toruni]